MDKERIQAGLTGPIASVHVPFFQNGEIDFDGISRLVDFTIAGGTRTMLLTYGNGLFSLLTDQEVVEVTKRVVEQTAGRALVVAADRMWWSGETMAFARFCREFGADILMVLLYSSVARRIRCRNSCYHGDLWPRPALAPRTLLQFE